MVLFYVKRYAPRIGILSFLILSFKTLTKRVVRSVLATGYTCMPLNTFV